MPTYLMHRQIDNSGETRCTKVLPTALTILNCNMQHRIASHTPHDARQRQTEIDIEHGGAQHKRKRKYAGGYVGYIVIVRKLMTKRERDMDQQFTHLKG